MITWFKKIWKQFRCKHEGVTWKVERKNAGIRYKQIVKLIADQKEKLLDG
jgi:hypothetical protein